MPRRYTPDEIDRATVLYLRLSKARKSAGLKQSDLAPLLSRTQSSFSRAERDGRFTTLELDFLLQRYGLAADDLFAPTTESEATMLAELHRDNAKVVEYWKEYERWYEDMQRGIMRPMPEMD